MDTIVNRLKEVIEKSGDSHAVLADKIGVQRANVSHVFSGRNKPSLDFVLRVIKCYPDVDADWLLMGKEPSSSKVTKPETKKPIDESPLFNNDKIEKSSGLDIRRKTESDNGDSDIERIIVFYKDRSFREYKPS